MTGTIQQFNTDANVLQTLLWQYENAPNLEALLTAKQDVWDEDFTSFWNDFYTSIFDLRTANNFGLMVWSIILDAPISYVITSGSNPGWAFGSNRGNFNNSNFSSNSGSNSTYPLSTETARVILRLRYYMLTGCCTVPSMNRMIADVFKNYGAGHVADGNDMTQKYIFNFVPPSDMQFAFNNYDVLPRPAGVGSGWTSFIEKPWGFNADATNFNNGNFTDG